MQPRRHATQEQHEHRSTPPSTWPTSAAAPAPPAATPPARARRPRTGRCERSPGGCASRRDRADRRQPPGPRGGARRRPRPRLRRPAGGDRRHRRRRWPTACEQIARCPTRSARSPTCASGRAASRSAGCGCRSASIGIIYESRPNVTIDAAGLCIKSGNATILRGGSEAIHSNRALAELVREGLAEAGLPADAVQLVGHHRPRGGRQPDHQPAVGRRDHPARRQVADRADLERRRRCR